MGVENEDLIHWWRRRVGVVMLIANLTISGLGVAAAHGDSCGDDALHDHAHHHHQHQHNGVHGHHHHQHHHEYDEHLKNVLEKEETRRMLPEELAEEEDLKLYGFDGGDHHHHYHLHHDGAAGDEELSGIGLWIHAMGCSLLVSLASLICLIILPVLFIQGKPSKAVVDSLALFGAGAMLGDAFLHQLPHAFGGEHSYSHDHHADNDHSHSGQGHLPSHSHSHSHAHSHSHSLKDLSVGLSVLAGIILFLLVEKLVRYVEDSSGGVGAWSHGHHHHHHKPNKKSKAANGATKIAEDVPRDENERSSSGMPADNGATKIVEDVPRVENERSSPPEEKMLDGVPADTLNGEKESQNDVLRKRKIGSAEDKADVSAANGSTDDTQSKEKEHAKSSSNLVFGYLNLFSDGVHNFTDGIALGSAFLLYGSIGGWSRTVFLLAHELPQEIGDFGILVRSGFSVSKALFFNFLSALVALAGTALALMMGKDPGQSSLIEGFTAGGFIYIAVAGVLAEMNTGSSSLKSTAIQLVSLMMGMVVALGISLAE